MNPAVDLLSRQCDHGHVPPSILDQSRTCYCRVPALPRFTALYTDRMVRLLVGQRLIHRCEHNRTEPGFWKPWTGPCGHDPPIYVAYADAPY
jgi:hypothetical protein